MRRLPLYFYAQLEDVTEHVLSKRQLQEQHRFIKDVANALPLLVYIYDLIASASPGVTGA